ncbi:hypothetical protein [Streptosporangium sp. NPDC002524]|uniref:hypothetical protein n=1 Tax=Streptosporangium sp. NPDC002524 TaxID=3154537 RepID=UPI00332692BA
MNESDTASFPDPAVSGEGKTLDRDRPEAGPPRRIRPAIARPSGVVIMWLEKDWTV